MELVTVKIQIPITLILLITAALMMVMFRELSMMIDLIMDIAQIPIHREQIGNIQTIMATIK